MIDESHIRWMRVRLDNFHWIFFYLFFVFFFFILVFHLEIHFVSVWRFCCCFSLFFSIKRIFLFNFLSFLLSLIILIICQHDCISNYNLNEMCRNISSFSSFLIMKVNQCNSNDTIHCKQFFFCIRNFSISLRHRFFFSPRNWLVQRIFCKIHC